MTVVNERCSTRCGKKRDEVLGRRLSEVWTEENVVDIEAQAATTMRTGRALTDQERAWISPDGSVRWFTFTHVPLRDHGTVVGPGLHGAGSHDAKALEQEILEISNREQRRLGSDLHDGLGQELTGLSLLLKGLEVQLSRESPQYSSQITKISDLLAHAIQSTRSLARGLAPVNLERGGLPEALKHLVARCTDMYSLQCTFANGGQKLPDLEEGAATHLYRIAQEATTNAARYARAKSIAIDLRIDGPQAAAVDRRRRHRPVRRPRAGPPRHGPEDHGISRAHARRHDQLRRARPRHAHRAVRAAASAAAVEGQAAEGRCESAESGIATIAELR